MNFKTVLQNAINHHYDLHKETISELGVAVMLWSKSNPKTQYEMLRVAKTKTIEELDLKAAKISILLDLFPDTYYLAWITNDARNILLNKYKNTFDVDQVKNNIELIRLWSLLCEGKMDSSLIHKYLI